jgi:hypothetical protein
VAVLLSPPWVVAEDLTLDGVEIREVRRYALWRRRELQWQHVTSDVLPELLGEHQVDLAIGGLRATPELEATARTARFSECRLDKDLCPQSRGFRHVWAVPRGAQREWAAVNAYLQVVRHRPVFAETTFA